MLIGIVRVFTILLSLLLGIWNFYAASGLAVAQSLLSDRVWLEQRINIFSEKELTEQNSYGQRCGGVIGSEHCPSINGGHRGSC